MELASSQQLRRYERIYTERFYVLDVSCADAAKIITIKLSGSTRCVYTLTLDEDGVLECDCPDFRGHCQHYRCLCKHLCFLIVKVGKSHPSQHMFTERRIRGETLVAVTERLRLLATGYAAVDPEVVDQGLLSRYAALAGEFSPVHSGDAGMAESDDCPVCYDALSDGEQQRCPDCRKHFHRSCMMRWLERRDTCPLCRSQAWSRFGSQVHSNGRYLRL